MNNNLVLIFLSCFLLSCDAGAGDSECTECGGGLLDGYLYKEVTVEDVAGLAEIDVSGVTVGKCIRFKLDGTEFSEATVVDDCCCIEYQ
jgi:hypothetical protein|tara:strand:+ start:81 stop:347 length:267 start_codon:yes stop_codon:yes gene_type:complete